MIDALSHLELFASADDAARALDDAARAGVTDVVTAGTNPLVDERVPTASTLAVPVRLRVHRAFGIHPEHVADVDAQLAALERRLDAHLEDVVAVGECGLDARPGMPPMALQERAFRAQIEIARARALPLVVHGVRCPRRILDALAGRGVRFVWHGFSGSVDVAEEAARHGGVISIGAAVLEEHHTRTREAAATLATCVVESDAPHGAGSAAVLPRIAQAIAALRGEDVDDVVKRVTAAARDLFALDPR